MSMPALTAPRAAGLLVGLLGASMAAGWEFPLDALVGLVAGFEHTGIVNPLLAVLPLVMEGKHLESP